MKDSVSSFGVEAVVTVDSKGQIVLPKGLRERAGLSQTRRLASYLLKKKAGYVVL
jgi:bifunctional DNA-binding transcriptional regulator/antitoxin component of YhaV-PrlF toxin-antitoxin module